jgi:hypothetical protein
MNIRKYVVIKRFIKGFLSSGIASAAVLAWNEEYRKIFLIAILTAIIQAIQKWVKEIEIEKQP